MKYYSARSNRVYCWSIPTTWFRFKTQLTHGEVKRPNRALITWSWVGELNSPTSLRQRRNNSKNFCQICLRKARKYPEHRRELGNSLLRWPKIRSHMYDRGTWAYQVNKITIVQMLATSHKDVPKSETSIMHYRQQIAAKLQNCSLTSRLTTKKIGVISQMPTTFGEICPYLISWQMLHSYGPGRSLNEIDRGVSRESFFHNRG